MANWGNYGAGISCGNYCSPTIDGNIIMDNSGHPRAGGICCSFSNSRITNNFISGNSAEEGGGIYSRRSSLFISNNIITENSALEGAGGGIFCDSGDTAVVNNRISGNEARLGGGILSYNHASGLIANNIITENLADDGGGIDCHLGAAPTIVNNTVAWNVSKNHGGGLYINEGIDLGAFNSIFWGNKSPVGKEICIDDQEYSPSTLTIDYSDVEGGVSSVYVGLNNTLNWGSAMIDADPLFADSGTYDVHLTWGSPCRDSGDNTAVSEQTDFEGDPRIALGTVDMGADEYYYHLYYVGDAVPGGAIDIRVIGYPSAPATLFLGSGVADPPYSTQYGLFYLQWPPLWLGLIGSIPQDGVLFWNTTIPLSWPSGSERPLQALVGPWGGAATRLTNLMELFVK